MFDYVIFTDANADLTEEMVNELGIQVLPMRFTLNDEEYYNYPDLRQMQLDTFYKELRNGGKTATTMTNISEYEDHFRSTLASGKDVLYVAFTSGLSGTQNAARLAAEQLAIEFPERKYLVADSLSISLGQSIVVMEAVRLQKEGKTIEEVKECVEDYAKHICHWVTVDDLHYLKRGGRLSSTSATFGTMLNMKPVLNVDNEGKIALVDKVRGRKNSILRLLSEMEKGSIDIKNQTIYIVHADCIDDANFLAEQIKSTLKPKKVIVTYVGPVIGGHAGPSAIATFFYGAHR